MAVSDFIVDMAKLIEQKSGIRDNVARVSSVPAMEWIPETQLSEMEVIQLRTAEETQNENAVTLKEFNPSFCLQEQRSIHCRVPGCSATTARRRPRTSEKIKQDLFLCQRHHTDLTKRVSKRCSVNFASFKAEDFNRYTNLIGLLERAFSHLKTSYDTTDSVLAEVFMNTRNFLVITNALLNPDEDNTFTVLASIMATLKKFLEDPKAYTDLVAQLKDLMPMILSFFGILYQWVSNKNPGARIGTGVGLLGGFLGALRFALPWPTGLAATGVGLVSGYLFGGGTYDWWKESHYIEIQKQMTENHQKFMLEQLKLQQGRHYKQTLFIVLAKRDGNILLKVIETEWTASS